MIPTLYSTVLSNNRTSQPVVVLNCALILTASKTFISGMKPMYCLLSIATRCWRKSFGATDWRWEWEKRRMASSNFYCIQVWGFSEADLEILTDQKVNLLRLWMIGLRKSISDDFSSAVCLHTGCVVAIQVAVVKFWLITNCSLLFIISVIYANMMVNFCSLHIEEIRRKVSRVLLWWAGPH